MPEDLNKITEKIEKQRRGFDGIASGVSLSNAAAAIGQSNLPSAVFLSYLALCFGQRAITGETFYIERRIGKELGHVKQKLVSYFRDKGSRPVPTQ